MACGRCLRTGRCVVSFHKFASLVITRAQRLAPKAEPREGDHQVRILIRSNDLDSRNCFTSRMFQPVNVLSRRVTTQEVAFDTDITTIFDQLAVSTLSGCSRKNESKCLPALSLYSLIEQLKTDVCRGNAGRGVQQYVESVESVEDIRGSVEFVFFITGNVICRNCSSHVVCS